MDNLQKLGLSRNDIDVYKYLARSGIRTAPEISSETLIDKSTLYSTLESLIKLNLITKSGEKRRHKYSITNSKEFKKLIAKKKEELKTIENSVNEFISDIDNYAKNSYKQDNITVYEGSQGYRSWIESRLSKEVKLIREIAPRRHMELHFDSYYEYMEAYIQKRIKLGIQINTLIDSSESLDTIDRTDEKMLKQAKVLNSELNLDAIFSTFSDHTAFYSNIDGKFIGTIIKDQYITNMQNGIFDYIWENAKLIY